MRTILITGVGQRLGLYLADHFLNQGDTVIGTYRTSRHSVSELAERGAKLFQVDFYQTEQSQAFIRWVNEQTSSLNVVIHNASDWAGDNGELNYCESQAVFQAMMTIHAEVPYLLNLAFESLLLNSEEGADVVHVSDYVAFKGSKKHIAYAASKSAMENLTLSFAQRFAPKIKVNSIAPALLAFNDHDDDKYKQKARAKSLMQTEGSFQEALDAILMLIKSRYITGRVIHLDGGRHLN